jgi:hypothetical protein
MRWYELLIEGPEGALESLLADPRDVIRGPELRLAESSMADRILEFLHAQTHHLVFASATRSRELVEAIREHPELTLEAVREVLGGRFGFKAEAYNREIGQKIHAALNDDLPAGVDCIDLEKEKTEPDAKGVELFAPVHEYIYKARGTIEGTAPGILEMNRRLCRLDFVHEEPLELECRQASAEGLS